MDICRNVYIEDSISKSGVNKFIKKIKANKPDIDLYVICVMGGSGSIMEIAHCGEYHKPHKKNKKYLVIGIAPNKNAALKLTVKILQDCILHKTELSSNEIYKFFLGQ